MFTDGLTLEEINEYSQDEFPMEFLHSLPSELQVLTKEYYDKMAKRNNSKSINNAIPMEYHSDIQNLFLKQAQKFDLKAYSNTQWCIYHYGVAETRNCRMIIRNFKSDFDTKLVSKFSIKSDAILFNNKYFFNGKIPLIISFNGESKGNITMGLYLRDSATSDMIAVNQLLKKAKENPNEILPPEKGRTASYEEQPKLQVRLKSGMD
ncbi:MULTISPECIES: hypothetical protein [Leptospira]|uniref:hypothetical protein n=1 Tax=Leptospira TaxID=171 RepID=UPI0002928004|nr:MULTISPECIES: hypothetical protein [Leptospira]EKO76842.1 hypothetical protein LEP1GSC068_0443 [Leptospira sp. Fiocruz LV3954]MDI7219249.1 hypothetical protein [Leptospira santarosai]MDI7219264.1 hypothetical protein [Leptospira santarosai]